jgi:hypothetical protein
MVMSANVVRTVGADAMPDELSADQISLLCNITDEARALADPQDLTSDLAILLSEGYVEAADDQSVSPYRLTAKGSAFLSVRGAGLNEA